jgi:hypothetical protein
VLSVVHGGREEGGGRDTENTTLVFWSTVKHNKLIC